MLNTVARNVRSVGSLVASARRDASDRLRFRLYEIARERALGIRTADGDADNGSPTEYQPYVAAPYSCLDTAFAAAGLDPGRDSFLDYGCGKGRVIAVAATLPFARVLGIELRPELVAVAEDNLRRVTPRRCDRTEVAIGDATAYVVPEDVTVIFLFNPFTRDVLRATLERIHESLARRPRDLRIVYMNPREDENLLAACDWLVCTRDLSPGRWRNMRFGLYRPRIGG